MNEDDDILAAEYALGLLSPDEAAATEARLRVEAPLSLRVAWWRDQLGPLADDTVEPPAHVWPRIAARLGVNDNAAGAARPWKWATGGMGAVTAALLAVIALRPEATPLPAPLPAPSAAAPMVASISGERGMAVTIAYEGGTGRMLVTPVKLEAGRGDAELWIIPAGATVPVSLGVIAADHATMRMMPGKDGMMLPGATFAISQEVKGGSTTGAPQGPVIASGKINTI